MKILETLAVIEKANRGGSYYERGSFLEGILLGILWGIPVSIFHYIHKPLGLLLLLIASLPIILLPRKFRGLRRYISAGFGIPGGSLRYSTRVFALFYFVLVGVTVALVMELFKFFFIK